MLRTLSLAALMAASLAGAATAQTSPIGKTISGQVRVCLRAGCLPAVKAQVYVSEARRVFDYSGSAEGSVTQLGQTVVEGTKQRRWTLSGNTLRGDLVQDGVTIRLAVRVAGNSCRADYDIRVVATGERAAVEVLSCRVLPGNHPY